MDPIILTAGSTASLREDGRDWRAYLLEPQRLNPYAYALNNPLKLTDTDGAYTETAIDLIFLALSARDLYLDPGIANGLWAAADVAGVALPIPAVAGYIRNGPRAAKILKFFSAVSRQSGKGISTIAKTYAHSSFFKQTRRQWTQGAAGDSLANLVGHFVKHGDEVGATSLEEYYKKANDFVDDIDTISFPDPFKPKSGDVIHYNPTTKQKAVTNSGGSIASYYIETRTDRLREYKDIIYR